MNLNKFLSTIIISIVDFPARFAEIHQVTIFQLSDNYVVILAN